MLPSCVEDVRASIDVDGDGDIRFPDLLHLGVFLLLGGAYRAPYGADKKTCVSVRTPFPYIGPNYQVLPFFRHP